MGWPLLVLEGQMEGGKADVGRAPLLLLAWTIQVLPRSRNASVSLPSIVMWGASVSFTYEMKYLPVDGLEANEMTQVCGVNCTTVG